MRGQIGPFIAVAYANESLGEIGTIYQAAGATYTGLTVPKGQANYLVHGRWLTAWQVRKRYGTRDRIRLIKVDPDLQVRLLRPKHRYVFVSAAKIQKSKILGKLTRRGLPYPRRPVD